MLKLYGYWRSSAAYRVRIGLHLKGIAFEQESINLAPSVRAHRSETFEAINPQKRVPVLETPEGALSQSMAILEWIEETYPEQSLLPDTVMARAQCRSFADIVACDVHPLNNPVVLQQLKAEFGASQHQVGQWYSDWIHRGFSALETYAQKRSGEFFFASGPSLAEICLIPQIYNARRFDVDLVNFPNLVEIDAHCMKIAAFQAAAPENQPDSLK